MVSPLKKFFWALVVWCVAVTALVATTAINPTQGFQVGKNLVEYYTPGLGWFVDNNTTTMLSKSTFQSGVCDFVISSNGTFAYTYTGFGAAGCQALTVYTKGMHFKLVVDVTNAEGGCSLNVDNVGVRNIKLADGSTDPAPSSLQPGWEYDIWFDGTVWRLSGVSASVSVAMCQSPSTCSGLYQVTIARVGQPNLVIQGVVPTQVAPAGAFPSPSFVINGN
jgi:hypothetical protein